MSTLVKRASRGHQGLQVDVLVVNLPTASTNPSQRVTGLTFADFASFTLEQNGVDAAFDPTSSGFAEVGDGRYRLTIPGRLAADFEGGFVSATTDSADQVVIGSALEWNSGLFHGLVDSGTGTSIATAGFTFPQGAFAWIVSGGGVGRAAYLSADNTLPEALTGRDANSVIAVFPDAPRLVDVDLSGVASTQDVADLDTAIDAVGGQVTALDVPTTAEIRTELSTELGRIDAPISSRATPAQITAAQNAVLAATGSDVPALVAAAVASILSQGGAGPWTTGSGGGSGGDSAASIYTYFTDGVRADAFKADIATLATEAALTALATALGQTNTDVEAVRAVTDQMRFTNANELDANTKSLNDAEVVGNGNTTPWNGA